LILQITESVYHIIKKNSTQIIKNKKAEQKTGNIG